MMSNKILLKQVCIIDPNSSHNGKKMDVLIEDGFIKKINKSISIDDNTKLIDEKGLYICPGLFDFSVDFGEPGEEHRETLESGCEAALYGGFTGFGLNPTDTPPRDNKSAISFCKNFTKNLPIEAFPYGCISKDMKGQQLAEMFDMTKAGAVAFTDFKKPVVQSGLLSRALLYTKNFDGLVISFPHDPTITPNGQMNEGLHSTQMGLDGIPTLAEKTILKRDLDINEYNDSRIHFNIISSASSVKEISNAKRLDQDVSCGTSIYHLLFDDSMLLDFNSNFKFLPPLRTSTDRDSLLKGLKDGTIDLITSNHQPNDIESTQVEFTQAAFGAIGTQIAFPLALTHLKEYLGIEGIISKMAINPRSILHLEVPMIEEKHKANITLFDPSKKWNFTKKDNKSLSENTPLFDTELEGKVFGTILDNQIHLNSETN
jgi:dihydroorotase